MPKGLTMKYFVLKPKGKDGYAASSRAAMRAYANSIETVDPELAVELRDWADRESEKADIPQIY